MMDHRDSGSTVAKANDLLDIAYQRLTGKPLFSGLTVSQFLRDTRDILPDKRAVAAQSLGKAVKAHCRKREIRDGVFVQTRRTSTDTGRVVEVNVYPEHLRPVIQDVYDQLLKSPTFWKYLRPKVRERLAKEELFECEEDKESSDTF